VSNPYLALRNRLLAIVCDARGADGSLGADALAKSIPLGRFRRAQDGAPLRDPAYPAGALDRAVRVDWLSEADDEGGNNPLQAPHFYAARISVTHALLYGTALSAALSVASGETAATVALQPQERALMDARRIRRALAFPELREKGVGKALCDGLHVSPLGDGHAYTTLASFDMTGNDAPTPATIESRPGTVFASSNRLYMATRHQRGADRRPHHIAGHRQRRHPGPRRQRQAHQPVHGDEGHVVGQQQGLAEGQQQEVAVHGAGLIQ